MSPWARAWKSVKPGIEISRRRGKRWRWKAVARQQRPREEVTSNPPGLLGTQHRLSACVARTTAQTKGSDVTGVGVGSSVQLQLVSNGCCLGDRTALCHQDRERGFAHAQLSPCLCAGMT